MTIYPCLNAIGIKTITVLASGHVQVDSIVYSDALQANGFEIAQYNTDGTLDKSYGVNGYSPLLPTENLQDAMDGIHQGGRHDFIVTYLDPTTSQKQYIFFSISPDGQLDSEAYLHMNSSLNTIITGDTPQLMYVQSDEKLLVPLAVDGINDFSLDRYTMTPYIPNIQPIISSLLGK